MDIYLQRRNLELYGCIVKKIKKEYEISLEGQRQSDEGRTSRANRPSSHI